MEIPFLQVDTGNANNAHMVAQALVEGQVLSRAGGAFKVAVRG